MLFGGASLAVLFADSADQLIAHPRRHGRRRRADHAGDALDHLERLPARGARQGDRHLGGHRRGRHRPRPADRRPAARVLRLEVGLPGQRARHRRRPARRPRARAREPRSAAGRLRPRRRRASRSRPSSRSSTASSRRPQRGWTSPLILGCFARRRRARRRVRALGAAHPRADAEPRASSATRASASPRARSASRSSRSSARSSRSRSTCRTRTATRALEAGAAMVPLALRPGDRRRLEHQGGAAPRHHARRHRRPARPRRPARLEPRLDARHVATGRSARGSSAWRVASAGSPGRRPSRSWAPCPRRRRASPRR